MFYREIESTIVCFVAEEDGQGINEYAAIMAFITLMCILVFTIARGTYFDAVTGTYSSITNEVNRVTNLSNF